MRKNEQDNSQNNLKVCNTENKLSVSRLIQPRGTNPLPSSINLRGYATPIYTDFPYADIACAICLAFNIINNRKRIFYYPEDNTKNQKILFKPSIFYTHYLIRKNHDMLRSPFYSDYLYSLIDFSGGLCGEKTWSSIIPIGINRNNWTSYLNDEEKFNIGKAEVEGKQMFESWKIINLPIDKENYIQPSICDSIKNILSQNIPVLAIIIKDIFTFIQISSTNKIERDSNGNITSGVLYYPKEEADINKYYFNGLRKPTQQPFVLVGYNDTNKYSFKKTLKNEEIKTYTYTGAFICQFPWKSGNDKTELLGENGFGYIPYDYMSDSRLVKELIYFTLPPKH